MQDVIILDAKGYGSCCSFNCKTTNEKTTSSANGIFIVRNESQRKQNPRKKNQKFCLKYVCLQQPYLNELHYTKEKKRKRNAKTKQQNWLNLEFRHLFHFFFLRFVSTSIYLSGIMRESYCFWTYAKCYLKTFFHSIRCCVYVFFSYRITSYMVNRFVYILFSLLSLCKRGKKKPFI